jgi:hypothetical protein
MAAGFRSPFFIWVGGLSAPVDNPSTECVCPTYTRDGSLSNQWTSDTCNPLRPELLLTIPMFRIYRFGSNVLTYKTDSTLTNQWGKRNCNG